MTDEYEKFTHDQRAAIFSRGENVIVSASAGSGKTTTMMKRVISLIRDEKVKASLDEMLVCTFTRASAADMKEKLFNELTEAYKNSGYDPRYEQQRSLLQTADVCTIDSWCQKIVKTYFYAINVDPGFDVLDQYAREALLSQSAEEAIVEALSEHNENFELLYDGLYSRRNHSKLRSIVTALYKFAIVQPDPEEWLNNCTRYYDGSFNKQYDEFFERMKIDFEEAFSRAQAAAVDEPDAQAKAGLLESLSRVADYVGRDGINLKTGKIGDKPSLSSKVKIVSKATYAFEIAADKANNYCKNKSKCAPQSINPAQGDEVVKLSKRTVKLFEEQ